MQTTRQSEPPHAEALVAPAATGLQAVLIDELHRRPPIKRRTLEIQRAPVAVLAIDILLPLRKGRRDQPGRARLAKIFQRALDIGKAEMYEAVAAQDGVAARQRILRDVGEMIVAFDLATPGSPPQRRDGLGHDIDADDAHAEIGTEDPAGITARRVQQRSY